MTSPTKNGPKSKKKTWFARGNPGGPGRPEGSRNKATVLLDQLADGDAEAILGKVLEKARSGDMKAAELVLARVWPPRKGRRVSLSLPSIQSSHDVLSAISAVLEATAQGEITPDEAALVASLLEVKRRAIETVELEGRLTKLEAAKEGAK